MVNSSQAREKMIPRITVGTDDERVGPERSIKKWGRKLSIIVIRQDLM